MIGPMTTARKLRAWVVLRKNPSRSMKPEFYVEDVDGSIAKAQRFRLGESDVLPAGNHTDGAAEEAIERELKDNTSGDFTLAKCALAAGEYHPRIWRGGFTHIDHDYIRALAGCLQSALTLFERQRQIFQTVHPVNDNKNAYGHELRNLLILASTNVEASLKAILKANGYLRVRPNGKDDYSTKDYVKLAEPMQLRHWKVGLPLYPDWGVLQPFRTWDVDKPSSSLLWYEAYNETKHDAEDKLNVATLRNVIDSVAAVYVLLVAQFGEKNLADNAHYSVTDYAVYASPPVVTSQLYAPCRAYDDTPAPVWTAVPLPLP